MSKRKNKKIKDLIAKGIIKDDMPAQKQRVAIGFQVQLKADKKPQRWGKDIAKPEPSLYDYKKSKQGVTIKRKSYKVFDRK